MPHINLTKLQAEHKNQREMLFSGQHVVVANSGSQVRLTLEAANFLSYCLVGKEHQYAAV